MTHIGNYSYVCNSATKGVLEHVLPRGNRIVHISTLPICFLYSACHKPRQVYIENGRVSLTNFDRTKLFVSFLINGLIGHFETVGDYACFQLMKSKAGMR